MVANADARMDAQMDGKLDAGATITIIVLVVE